MDQLPVSLSHAMTAPTSSFKTQLSDLGSWRSNGDAASEGTMLSPSPDIFWWPKLVLLMEDRINYLRELRLALMETTVPWGQCSLPLPASVQKVLQKYNSLSGAQWSDLHILWQRSVVGPSWILETRGSSPQKQDSSIFMDGLFRGINGPIRCVNICLLYVLDPR